MNKSYRYIGAIFLATALTAPIAVIAAPAPQAAVQVRVYDAEHKDYHNWDDHERHAWGVFLTDNHRHDHEYAHANRKEQREYWNWRHSHPD